MNSATGGRQKQINTFIYILFCFWSVRSLWCRIAHTKRPILSVCLYNNVLRRGVCTKQTLPAHALLAFSARTIYISKCRMEKHTNARGNTTLAFIYFAILLFSSVDDSASSGRKICIFCGAYRVLATENSAIHC